MGERTVPVADPTVPVSEEPIERWRPAATAPKLEVSDLGRVRVASTARLITPRLVQVKRTQPRLQVAYTEQSVKHHRRVARLVCQAFHGDPPPDHVTMVNDGDSLNCRADTLRRATRAEVAQATVARGRHHSGQQILVERRRRRDGDTAQTS